MTSLQWTIRLDLGENIKMMANCTRYTTENSSQHLQYYELIDVILVCEMWSYSVKRNKDDMLPMRLTLLRWLWWDSIILFNQWMNSLWYMGIQCIVLCYEWQSRICWQMYSGFIFNVPMIQLRSKSKLNEFYLLLRYTEVQNISKGENGTNRLKSFSNDISNRMKINIRQTHFLIIRIPKIVYNNTIISWWICCLSTPMF